MDVYITSSFSNLTCRYYVYTRKSCNTEIRFQRHWHRSFKDVRVAAKKKAPDASLVGGDAERMSFADDYVDGSISDV